MPVLRPHEKRQEIGHLGHLMNKISTDPVPHSPNQVKSSWGRAEGMCTTVQAISDDLRTRFGVDATAPHALGVGGPELKSLGLLRKGFNLISESQTYGLAFTLVTVKGHRVRVSLRGNFQAGLVEVKVELPGACEILSRGQGGRLEIRYPLIVMTRFDTNDSIKIRRTGRLGLHLSGSQINP